MGRHSDVVSYFHLENLLKVNPAQCTLRRMMLTILKVDLCWQLPVPSDHEHHQDLHPALLLSPLRDTRDTSRI